MVVLKKHFSTFLFVIEICALVVTRLVGMLPTNANPILTIIIIIMIIVEIGAEIEAYNKLKQVIQMS